MLMKDVTNVTPWFEVPECSMQKFENLWHSQALPEGKQKATKDCCAVSLSRACSRFVIVHSSAKSKMLRSALSKKGLSISHVAKDYNRTSSFSVNTPNKKP